MSTLSTLRTLLMIEESQTREFRAVMERADDPVVRAVFRILADNEETHANWVRDLIARRESPELEVKGPHHTTAAELEQMLVDENEEAEWFDEIAGGITDPEVKVILTTIARDEVRNARLIRELFERAKASAGAGIRR